MIEQLVAILVLRGGYALLVCRSLRLASSFGCVKGVGERSGVSLDRPGT